MAAKYQPLTEYLQSIPLDEEVGIDMRVVDRMVGGLPPSSSSPGWWANTTGHSQALAWISVGRQARVDLSAGRVVFSAANVPMARTARAAATHRVPVVMNGVKALEDVLRRAGYTSIAAAVAEYTVFLDPRTVAQTGGQAVFPVIRDMLPDGRKVLLDDNTTPTWRFLWAAGRNKGLGVQYNHVWTDAQNAELYTALWNLCATPAFLAKTTDGQNHPEVRAVLRYRAYQLYEAHPQGQARPPKPEDFDQLIWAPMPDPISDLEATYRIRLAATSKSRMAVAAREIGWLFSNWHPDTSVPGRMQGA